MHLNSTIDLAGAPSLRKAVVQFQIQYLSGFTPADENVLRPRERRRLRSHTSAYSRYERSLAGLAPVQPFAGTQTGTTGTASTNLPSTGRLFVGGCVLAVLVGPQNQLGPRWLVRQANPPSRGPDRRPKQFTRRYYPDMADKKNNAETAESTPFLHDKLVIQGMSQWMLLVHVSFEIGIRGLELPKGSSDRDHFLKIAFDVRAEADRLFALLPIYTYLHP